ncbi:MAG TPA: D-2-hydroxyacid dehydrogenase family protein [Usitatibacter sp.]|jgi:phosphoglycerate dehydrogenase-like enzyme|nr:D-2-hydroxyacid dehydrogenase family protein [Usitatibacter sp.]
MSPGSRPRIAVLDDYEQLLRKSGDWAAVDALAEVVVHHERLRGEKLLAAIRDADAIVLIRDRTPFKAELLAQLPKLRFFTFTGGRNTTMDAAAFKARGIPVANTEMGQSKDSTAELAWTLILAAAKRLEAYLGLVRQGRWRDGKGLPVVLAGERLGIIGFGDIGQRVGRVGQAFGMEVVCWSPNMTAARATQGGAKSVILEDLLKTSRVVSLSLVPSDATRKLLNAERLALMRPDSILVNTARSALIDMAALEAALEKGRPGVAALDVYDDEPLAPGSSLAKRENVVLTPHLGFVNDPVFSKFGPGVVENLLAWLRNEPQPRLVG